MNELAIVSLSPIGLALGQRLVGELGRGEVVPVQGSARQTLHDLFCAGRPLVCVMALGIVVRILGPLARNKDSDPPVVVVDEAGRFAISALGGHGAGANALAKEVAKALDAVPVITTASDTFGLPAVDLIGQAWGWKIEGREQLTKLAASVVHGDPIGVYQDAGCRDWYAPFGDWPETFVSIPSWPPEQNFAGLLLISDRRIDLGVLPPALVYRPPTLVLGVGCRRGVANDEIETLFQSVCRDHDLAPLCLGMVATVTLKSQEQGLQEFATHHGVALRCFSLEELAQVPGIPTPSEKVRSKIGVAGVAEPAAMLAADSSSLIVPKLRGERVTMALARRDDA